LVNKTLLLLQHQTQQEEKIFLVNIQEKEDGGLEVARKIPSCNLSCMSSERFLSRGNPTKKRSQRKTSPSFLFFSERK
jgi:hypothetical protein